MGMLGLIEASTAAPAATAAPPVRPGAPPVRDDGSGHRRSVRHCRRCAVATPHWRWVEPAPGRGEPAARMLVGLLNLLLSRWECIVCTGPDEE